LKWSPDFGQADKLGLPLQETGIRMAGKRNRYSAEFKARVASEVPRGELTTAQLVAKNGVHQTMAGEWKKQAMEGLVSVFSGKMEPAVAA
jgi:transposase-like protein